MVFTLEMLSEFIHGRKREFVGIITREARKLTLKQIVSETEGASWLVGDIVNKCDDKFKEGDKIKFRLHYLDFCLSPEELLVDYSYITLKRFSGTNVKKFYSKLFSSVKKEIDDQLDLPF